jgi:cytochrome c nitrite reductase small subunit
MLLKNIINRFKPNAFWHVPVLLLLGIITGLFFFIFYISNAVSYVSDQPKTCVNCHIMAPQYATWFHSSHREQAHCNDCHVPHNNFLNKYYFKAMDGMRHATIFTLRMEPQVIFIKNAGKKVVQQNCIRCHSDLIEGKSFFHQQNEFSHFRENRYCWECHRETPHGRVNSLSSVPDARVPLPKTPVPAWIQKWMNSFDQNK